MKTDRAIIIWLIIGCLMIFSMIAIGGITRLTNSGLSMVEWKLISGALPPMNDLEWQEAFNKYKAYPEFKHVNAHFDLNDFKSIFWWEYIHRMLGRLLGIVFIVPYLFFLWKGRVAPTLNKKLILIFLLGALQGFFGWFMVKSGLVDRPDVSHFRLALHLVTAFITCSYIFWVVLELIYGTSEKQKPQPSPLYKTILIFLGVLIVQITFGAFVAGMNAGMVYNTFPKMDSHWIPPIVLNGGFSELINGVAGVQFVHRFLAITLFFFILILRMRLKKYRLNRHQTNSVNIIVIILSIQFTLGLLTLIYQVPTTLALIHQLGAFLLLIAVVNALFHFKHPVS